MKIKLSKEQIKKIVDDPEAAAAAKIKVSDPWWVILLKIISYVCGLIAGGALTIACTTAMANI